MSIKNTIAACTKCQQQIERDLDALEKADIGKYTLCTIGYIAGTILSIGLSKNLEKFIPYLSLADEQQKVIAGVVIASASTYFLNLTLKNANNKYSKKIDELLTITDIKAELQIGY